MDDDCATDVSDPNQLHHQEPFVSRVHHNLEHSQSHDLCRADLADECPKADEHGGRGKVAIDELEERDAHRERMGVRVREHEENAFNYDRPLHGQGSDEHCKANGAEAVVLQECHEVTETDLRRQARMVRSRTATQASATALSGRSESSGRRGKLTSIISAMSR